MRSNHKWRFNGPHIHPMVQAYADWKSSEKKLAFMPSAETVNFRVNIMCESIKLVVSIQCLFQN